MRKLILFDHVSFDGFAAGPNGEMDWIYVDDEMFQLAAHMTDHADAALYGRVTFEMMDSYWPTAGDQPNASLHDRQHSAWYNKVPKFVMSRTIKSNSQDVTIMSGDVVSAIKALKDDVGSNILMLGSPSAAHLLMEENLIDEYWLFINPLLVGKGIGLFPELKQKLRLKLLETRSFNAGVVMVRYEALS